MPRSNTIQLSVETKEEIWKDIQNYDGYYQISTFGRIRSLDRYIEYYRYNKKIHKFVRGRILVPYHAFGYQMITLSVNGIHKKFHIHRLVAETFISNQNNFEDVNHIDGNKDNNNVNNLEWCTHKYNMEHAWDIGLCTNLKPKSIPVLCVEDNKEFQCVADAARYYNINPSLIWNRLEDNDTKLSYLKYNKTFAKKDDNGDWYVPSSANFHKILCIDDKLAFSSYAQAGRYYNIKDESVKRSCLRNTSLPKIKKSFRLVTTIEECEGYTYAEV